MFRIDDHVGIAIAGLTSDARVLRYDINIHSRCPCNYRNVVVQQFYAPTSDVFAHDLQPTGACQQIRLRHRRQCVRPIPLEIYLFL